MGGVEAAPPHRHERTRGETIDRLPFAFDRRQRVAPDSALAPSLALSRALLGCAHRLPGNPLRTADVWGGSFPALLVDQVEVGKGRLLLIHQQGWEGAAQHISRPQR